MRRIATVALLVLGLTIGISVLTFGSGAGSPAECNGLVEIQGDPTASHTAPSGQIVTGVCIKAGPLHTGLLGNGTFSGASDPNCYQVNGVGTQTVTVTRIGTEGPGCQAISHVDVKTGTAPPPSRTLTVTASPAGAQGGTFTLTVNSGSCSPGGGSYTTPKSFTCNNNSQVTVSNPQSPVPTSPIDTRYLFASFSPSASVTLDADKTITINYTTQFLVSYAVTGCNGLTVTPPAAEWVNAGGTATGSFPAQVTNGGTRCNFISDNRPATITGPTTITGSYQTQFLVSYTATGCTLSVSVPPAEWVNSGGTATGSFPAQVTNGGTRCNFASDNRPATITSPTTVTGTYQTQFLVTYAVTGCSLSVTPPASEWVNSGGTAIGSFPAQVTNGGTRCNFVSDNRPSAITAPTTVTGIYQTQYLVSYTASGCGLSVTVPDEWVNAGGNATGNFPALVTNGGTRCQLLSQSSAGPINAPTTRAGSYKTQHRLLLSIDPGAVPGGLGNISGATSGDFFDSGATVNLTANALVTISSDTRFRFSNWNGDCSGTSLTISVTMSVAKSCQAKYIQQFQVLFTQVGALGTANVQFIGTHSVPFSDFFDAGSNLGSFQYTPIVGQSFCQLSCSGTIGVLNSPRVITAIYVLDNKPPSLTCVPLTLPNAFGWYKTDVVIHFIANDTGSGLDLLDGTIPLGGVAHYEFDKTITGEGINLSISAKVRDRTGNEATVSCQANIDRTPPTLALVFTPNSPDGNSGWWKTPGGVPFAWTCSDALSGIDSTFGGGCPSPLTGTVTTQGTTNFTDQVRDQAGNLSVVVNRDLKLDNVAPNVVANAATDSCSLPGNNGWCRGTQTLGFRATDGTSGLAALNGCATGSASCDFTRSTSTNGSAVPIASGAVSDVAGNTNPGITRTAKIDSVAPTIVPSRTPAPNVYGWNNTNVTVNFICSDATSGIASCGPTPQVITTEGPNQSLTGLAEDNAGNTASATVNGINIDKTPPIIISTVTPPPGPAGIITTDGNVIVSYNCSDPPNASNGTAASGIASCSAPAVFTTEGAQTATGLAKDRADNIATTLVRFIIARQQKMIIQVRIKDEEIPPVGEEMTVEIILRFAPQGLQRYDLVLHIGDAIGASKIARIEKIESKTIDPRFFKVADKRDFFVRFKAEDNEDVIRPAATNIVIAEAKLRILLPGRSLLWLESPPTTVVDDKGQVVSPKDIIIIPAEFEVK